jgi:hypothetical protein
MYPTAHYHGSIAKGYWAIQHRRPIATGMLITSLIGLVAILYLAGSTPRVRSRHEDA